jgi:hypothetical protein
MKRPSYRAGVAWIAGNDQPNEEDPEAVSASHTVIGRFKTSHSWALWKTSHDVMGFVSSTRLYSDDKLGQLA